jgi:hypothetical protein
METVKRQVLTLVRNAAESIDSADAMKFSQAALNAANALSILSSFGLLLDYSKNKIGGEE